MHHCPAHGAVADLPVTPEGTLAKGGLHCRMSGVDRNYIVPSFSTVIVRPPNFFSSFLSTTAVPSSYGLSSTNTFSRLLFSPMTLVETVPSVLQAAVPISQPSHLEGDPALATEILPGPPSLLSVQQSAVRKDTKKPSFALSYLPTSDPGSTYSLLGLAHTPTVVSMGVDGPRRKRPRTSKVCVSLSFHHTSCANPVLSDRSHPKVPLFQRSNQEFQRGHDRRIVRLLSRPQAVTKWRRAGQPSLKTSPSDPLRLLIRTNPWLLGQIQCQIWMKPPHK